MKQNVEIKTILVTSRNKDTDIIKISCGSIKLHVSRDEAEEIYDRLDFILHDETRAEVEKQLEDLELREDKLRESVAFVRNYEEPENFYDLVI